MIIPNNDIANKKIINMMEPDRKLKIMVQDQCRLRLTGRKGHAAY